MAPVLTHIALHVADIDRCIDFYQRYCGLHISHDRTEDGRRVVWLAERGREQELILVLIPGGPPRAQTEADFSHLGFALDSRDAVDAVAAMAARENCLLWPPRDNPWPVGYYCGVRDPDGQAVEFSYGQPLGPGAQDSVSN